MEWYNEPSEWSDNSQLVKVKTNAKTDFWRETHYGFIRDSGHFYYREVTGDFTVAAKISGHYESLYDQAGLMIRLDEANWMKCGIEFVNGVQQASVVLTRDYSDWSVVSLPQNPVAIWLRVERRKETVEVSYSLTGEDYEMLRLAYLMPTVEAQVGLMCASPEGAGFEATFEELTIRSL